MQRLQNREILNIEEIREKILSIETEIRKRIVGMNEVVKLLLVGLFASPGRNCHILLEGVPGLAKTLLLRTLAESVEGKFRRISFAADLLPKDVVGIEDFDPATGKVKILVKGPLFTNFLLADELNRARTSSKGMILEPMEEGRVTTELGGTHPLAEMFMVAATQNPIEEEGTFVLGRAEQDRFVMKILVNYPDDIEEQDVIRRNIESAQMPEITPVMDTQHVLNIRNSILEQVKVSDEMIEKVQRLVMLTRPGYSDMQCVSDYVDAQDGGGASPRAGIQLLRTGRAHAAICGRAYVSPEDIAAVVLPTLRHRLILRPELEMRSVKEREKVLHELVDRIFQRVWSP